MTLEATFSLTPRESNYYVDPHQYARLFVFGADFYPRYQEGYPLSYDDQHANDRLYFAGNFAADPTLDYTNWQNLKKPGL